MGIRKVSNNKTYLKLTHCKLFMPYDRPHMTFY